MKKLLFRIRWWRWFLSSPPRIHYGFGPHASENWRIAQDRWMKQEPTADERTTHPNQQTASIQNQNNSRDAA
jgi:hypothetical protein